MYCPECGTQNDDNAFKCLNCGIIIQQVPVPPPIPVKQSNTAVVVLAICGGAFALISILGILAAIAIPNFIAYRQKALDGQTEAVLYDACSEAQAYFLEYASDNISYEILAGRGVTIPPEIEFYIEDSTRENLTMTARHIRGDKTFVSDKECNIEEAYQ
jgi:hypothetical protein